MSDNPPGPVVISVVSGKGGVGKSRLSIALASILSKKYKVLLIDFDLHNQGLTHLVDVECRRSDPSIDGIISGENYCAPVEIARNIFFIPAIKAGTAGSPNDLEKLLTSYTAADFKDMLANLVRTVRSSVPVRFVIIDNTGIPDDFSIGSALYADRVLLLTQTDSVTWRGALNFYSIYENSGGDTTRMNFVVNNIPKKYSFELVNLEVNKLGEVFKNLGFTLFIPFEYGIFESFDRNPFDDRYLEKSEFYQKVGLLSAIILKESGVERSGELDVVYSNKNHLNRSLDTRLNRSGDSMKHLLIVKSFQLIFGSLFIIFGLVTVATFYPDAIPSLLGELNGGHYLPILLIAASFLIAVGVLLMSAERFVRYVGAMGDKKTDE
jgi:cellulose biosynthesis protein BcsQ